MPNTSEPTNPHVRASAQGSRSLGIEFDQHGVMQTRNNGTDSPFLDDERPTTESHSSRFSLAMVKVRQKVRQISANGLRGPQDLADKEHPGRRTADGSLGLGRSRRGRWFKVSSINT